MSEHRKFADARDEILGINYPPTTLKIEPRQAIGYRLSRQVTARGNQPSRPFALTSGLALVARDIVSRELELAEPEHDDTEDYADDNGQESAPEPPGTADAAPDEKDVSPPADSAADGNTPKVNITLRPFPKTNRKEDALAPGQAVIVPAGGEIPRGGDTIVPLAELVDKGLIELPEPVAKPESEPDAAGAPAEQQVAGNGGANGEDDDDNLPAVEPTARWNLPQHFTAGALELPRLSERPDPQMIPIGAWARNREVLIPEKTVLRAAEAAILEALGVEEVDVFRRPVVGVASLAPVFPTASRQNSDQRSDDKQADCPLMLTACNICRTSGVAALPLGYAPMQFISLKQAVERWVKQVDILLLVGGTNLGPECRALDLLNAVGSATLSGVAVEPGGSLSAGTISGQPVFAIPGSLPDVITGTVLFARPLMHKYVMPLNYEDQLELVLENGSKLDYPETTVRPVKFGFNAELGRLTTRFSGRLYDPWLDWIRGQALVVFDGGRQYADGDTITAWRY